MRSVVFDSDQTSYVDLRAIIAERANGVVCWVGAGLSAPAGIPSWPELRLALTRALEAKARTLDSAGETKLRSYAENAKKANTHWDAFLILRKGLGETTYEAEIKRAFAPAQTARIPTAYSQLWRLPIAGIVNLNIDRIASRAFSAVYGGDRIAAEFSSNEVGAHTHILNNPYTKFIYNAHGKDDDVNSWVFTHDELQSLLKNGAYVNFINNILSSSTVVFIGISADDLAAGGHLNRLRGLGIRTTQHFWITDRRDTLTEEWAEKSGVRVIRYPNADGAHTELNKILDELRTYVAEDEPIPDTPVAPDRSLKPEELPTPDVLRREEPEMIRLFLNAHAQQLLSVESDQAYATYREFVQEYTLPIHIAWFVDAQAGLNVVLGFTVVERAAQGAFGTVYRAYDRNGKTVAIKVLREDIRNDHNALSSFRRGVGSMKILSQNKVKGMVAYLEAAEIPAMVVMEWIEGDNLRAAVANKRVSTWEDLLKVAVSLASILRDAHNLPQRVLHRDLRPANIMLEGLYGPKAWKVKVLDFDLSWHRGAYDHTVLHEAGTTGYLAPEQIQRFEGVSTRHSAVDAFGLGMTFFFMLTGTDPMQNQQRHADWERTVTEAARRKAPCEWRSLSDRFARLVLAATQTKQVDRPDITAMHMELLRMQAVLSGASATTSLDLLAEELASRAEAFRGYQWSNDQLAAKVERPTGLSIELRANEARGRVGVFFRHVDQGFGSKRALNKKLGPALAEAKRLLTTGQWKVETCQVEGLSLHVVAYARPETIVTKLQPSASLLDKVARVLDVT